MALYAYRAIDGEGRVSSGSLDAANAIDLELRLKRLGLDLLTFDEAGLISELKVMVRPLSGTNSLAAAMGERFEALGLAPPR